MSQSDERARGRGRSAPPSFGRQADPEQPKVEDFKIVGGQAFHLVLHVDVTPTPESLTALYEAVRVQTAQGVRDGYAEAIAELAGAQDGDAASGPGGSPAAG